MEDESVEKKKKKNSIFKKLERYVSSRRGSKSSAPARRGVFTKSRSWHSSSKAGCFSVYVGAEKQRFVIKTETANHPSFKMLLEDAELEYGFKNEGPLVLPCEVDLFCRILAEMDGGDQVDARAAGYGSCSPFSPVRRLGGSDMARGYSSYALLTPPRRRLFKINNQF